MQRREKHVRSPVSAYWRNLRVDMPLSEKLRVLGKNMTIRITRMQPCCGHPGEPGC
jgi:hypothetical protein